MRKPWPEFQKPKSRIQNPVSKDQSPKIKVENLKFNILNPKFGVQNPKIQSPMSKSQNPWAGSRNTKQNRKWMTFVLFLPLCPNAGEQKYCKKTIGNEWFWYYSCLRALVQESRNTEKHNGNWMISSWLRTPQDDISWLPAFVPWWRTCDFLL